MNLGERYLEVRHATESLVAHLDPEDLVVQSMPEASPAKWHLAHTTWFFETFLLSDAPPFDPSFAPLFNSYYESLGERVARHARGMLTRPPLSRVLAYRHAIDAALFDQLEHRRVDPSLLLLGLHHEQQHQELLLTDLLHAFHQNPLRPPYRPSTEGHGSPSHFPAPLRWIDYPAALHWLGADDREFSYDHERPRHAVLLPDFQLASRLVTNGEFREFIEEGGYARPELWLSEGFGRWQNPLYWEGGDAFTLHGMAPRDPEAPVSHVSYFEADAYARWKGARLPTEAEWEHVASTQPVEGNFVESEALRPRPGAGGQYFGDVWEWTASAYLPYPGFLPEVGAAREYNGKFMSNQMVLRGGSCLSPRSHLRATYRNYFAPHARWQMTGVRLAR